MVQRILKNSAYKHLAPFYDKSTNLKIFTIYKSIIGKVKNKCILDLGCGTGTLLKNYSLNNKTFGIDVSPEMINIAKAKDKNSSYKIGDIKKFKLEKKFNIITCAYDTINHLQSLKSWGRLFKNVSAHLTDDGIFIFDYNTIEGLKNSSGTILQKIDGNYIIRRVKNKRQTCFWEFHGFIKQSSNLFKYQKTIIREKSYPDQAVEKEVSKYFEIIDIIRNNNNRVYVKSKKKRPDISTLGRL